MVHDCPRVPHLGLCSVAALLRLHRKSKSLDTYLDDRLELSTTRVAWNEITDNVERGASPLVCTRLPGAHRPRWTEASTRTAFLENLGAHVIDPLANFKVRFTLCSASAVYGSPVYARRSKIASANGSRKT